LAKLREELLMLDFGGFCFSLLVSVEFNILFF
jgi:hypothetical protein